MEGDFMKRPAKAWQLVWLALQAGREQNTIAAKDDPDRLFLQRQVRPS